MASDNVSTRLRSAAQGGRSVTLSFGRVGLPMKLVGDAITQAKDEYDACRERFDSYGRAQARQSSLGGGEPLTGTADLTAMDYPRGQRPRQTHSKIGGAGNPEFYRRSLSCTRQNVSKLVNSNRSEAKLTACCSLQIRMRWPDLL